MIRMIRMWWYRRRMHPECAENQLNLWRGQMAPLGACTTCLPRIEWIRKQLIPVMRVLR